MFEVCYELVYVFSGAAAIMLCLPDTQVAADCMSRLARLCPYFLSGCCNFFAFTCHKTDC